METAAVYACTSLVRVLKWPLATLALTVFLAACTGSTGATGATGNTGATGPQGPSGPTGPVTALDVSTATQLTATITSVTFPASGPMKPVVKFQLLNQVGQPISGLKAGNLGFAIAKLVPPGTQLKAVPPLTAAPAPATFSQWQSYIYLTANPAPANGSTTTQVVGTTPQPQATVEAGTAGTFVDNGDGTYQYTFAKDISKDPAVTYDATLTHRVAFEIRGVAPANSPVYTVQPATGATTSLASREIVDDQTCKNCHSELAFHGGARTSVQYCVMCHNPSSIDPSSGNSIDFKDMFHKIHMGADLPTVKAGAHYYIFGFRNAISDYSDVEFPVHDASNNNAATSGPGQRFCSTCHDTTDTNAPQAGNFASAPSAEACGSCHDDVNFATGANHSAANLVATDTDCVTCHGPSSTIDNGALQVVTVHQNAVDIAAAKFKFAVVSATNTGQGQTPTVTIKVTDPTNNSAPYDITAPGGPFTTGSARLVVDLAWNTAEFNNIGSNSATAPATGTPNQPLSLNFLGTSPAPTNNGDGTFTLTSAVAVPAGVTGSG